MTSIEDIMTELRSDGPISPVTRKMMISLLGLGLRPTCRPPRLPPDAIPPRLKATTINRTKIAALAYSI